MRKICFHPIRGKGAHRDNPDPCQFRAALRQVMVDRIMVTSDSSNCEADVDDFLFSLSSLSSRSENPVAALDVNEQAQSDIPESDRSIMAVFMQTEVLSVEENNILYYISGYVARKVSSKVCGDCKSVLTGQANSLDIAIVHFFSGKTV